MDTTQPPIMCAACNQPIGPGDASTWRHGQDKDGRLVASELYHRDCAPADESA